MIVGCVALKSFAAGRVKIAKHLMDASIPISA